MKIEIFTEGIGRVIASGYAMRHCISFLKSVYPKRFRWIKKDGIDFDKVDYINWTPRDQWIFDNAMEIEMIDPVENSEKVWWDHKKGEYISLDNAIHIAAQDRGETCETNCSFCESNKEHYKQMSEFFDEMIEHLNFHTFVARCSRCGKPDASYVGLISGKTIFAFCVDCRDELTLKQNAARAALERIGA